LGTTGLDATRDSRARAFFTSPELESRRVALEFCVQTEGGVTVGDVNGYRVCDEFGREAGLF